jgi:hypothetical protein
MDGSQFHINECEDHKHQLLPVMDGAVCTVCGKQYRWVVYTTYPKMQAKPVEKKPWQAKPHLMQ